MAYWQWGDPDNPNVLVCAHGLTRNGRDYDVLAERLAAKYRVICPDMIGRGASDSVADPNLYVVPQYIADCVSLIARLDVEHIAWLGTSMGALIGMAYAATPGNPIRRLIMVDIGPVIDEAGRKRIAGYVGGDPDFGSFDEGERALRELMVDFGPHTDEQFRFLSRNYLVERNGRWRFNYDPAISVPFHSTMNAPMPSLWPLYDAVKCPTLVIRGGHSDILGRDIALEMTRRGPRAELVEFDGIGHAPTLIANDQTDCVEGFLSQPMSELSR
jgi:pimeloyl-ACP methyl ester carboxylesterase